MKQIAFVSGKGGTGKSTLVSSLNILVKSKVMADCDVDAPNLHLLVKGDVIEEREFSGAKQAFIDPSACVQCGLCRKTCRFEAISEDFRVIPLKCEGCGACTLVCPSQAIRLEEVKTGMTYVTKTSRGTFAHALLDPGAEGSGRLVTEVRKKAKEFTQDEEWILIDGSPGIGCVVIASITGADAVVAVTEPTKTALGDLQRVLGLAGHFGIPAYVCINKYDLNKEVTGQTEEFCRQNGFPVIGEIPFDPSVVEALRDYKTPIEAGNSRITEEIESIWKRLENEVSRKETEGR